MDIFNEKMGYYDLCVPEESYLSSDFDKMAQTYLNCMYVGYVFQLIIQCFQMASGLLQSIRWWTMAT